MTSKNVLLLAIMSIVAVFTSATYSKHHVTTFTPFNDTAGLYEPIDKNNMYQYCKTEIRTPSKIYTIDHKPSSIICPKMAAKVKNKYVCYNLSKMTLTPFSRYRNRPMMDFMKFLKEKKFRLMIVGDSLSTQQYNALQCNLESEGAGEEDKLEHDKLVSLKNSMFLAPVDNYKLADWKQNDSVLTNSRWSYAVTRYKFTHVVINTGAWWNYDRFVPSSSHPRYKTGSKRKLTDAELLAAFAAHFSTSGYLYDILYQLRKQGVQIIWRDVTAAGMCTDHKINDSWEYRKLFPVFNAIARKAVLAMGGLVIPDIWNSSVGYWADHRYSFPHRDWLHWCDSTKESLPALWNSKLFELLQSQPDKIPPLPASLPKPRNMHRPDKWWMSGANLEELNVQAGGTDKVVEQVQDELDGQGHGDLSQEHPDPDHDHHRSAGSEQPGDSPSPAGAASAPVPTTEAKSAVPAPASGAKSAAPAPASDVKPAVKPVEMATAAAPAGNITMVASVNKTTDASNHSRTDNGSRSHSGSHNGRGKSRASGRASGH